MIKSIALQPFAKAILNHRLSAVASLLMPGLVLAGPTGGTVIAGQIGITSPNAATTIINQSSQGAIINWQQFSIGNGEYVVFNQPNASAAVLNRIVGGAPSEILGNLSANGRVFLVNPQGVIFGKGAQVDVGSLVATTMNIADQDFLTGHYVFANGTQAPVTNAGVINAAKGGYVVLAGDYVNNTGVIQAKLGDVVLASGSAMTLDLAGDGLINLNVSQSALSDRAGVNNLGEIAAQGGTVVMTAKVARNLAATAVNNSGIIKAQGISEQGGDIYLTADGGNVVNAGSLDVSGLNGHNAGDIRISSSHDITLAAGSSLLATGASGGDVRAVAANHLDVVHGAYANVSRQAKNGKGGFAEYSGHKSVTIRDIVHLGEHGALLVDPTDITIGYGGSASNGYDQATIESQLQNNFSSSTFTIDASSGTGVDVGNITVLGNLNGNTLNGHSNLQGYGGSLMLIAGPNGSIQFSNQATLFDIAGDLTIHGGTTGGSQVLGNLSTGGLLTIDGYGGINSGYLHATTGLSVTSTTGDIKFTNLALVNSVNGSAVTPEGVDATVTASGGSISGQYVFLDNSLSQTSSGSGEAATLTLDAKNSINITGTNANTGSSITVLGGGGRGFGGAIDTTASATLTAGTAVHIAGPVAINGLDYHFVSETGDSIHSGGAQFNVTADTIALDNSLDVSGEGFVTASLSGHHGVTVSGSTHVTASAASIATTDANSDTVNVQYGYAAVFLTADENNSGAVPTTSVVRAGNISATGPNAIIAVTAGSAEIGDGNNTASDFGIDADASTSAAKTQITDSSDNIVYQTNSGAAQISILTGGATAGKGIITHGGIAAAGPAAQINLLAAKNIDIGGSISATGNGYTESGNSSFNSFAFLSQLPTSPGVSFASNAPFKLQQGSLTWGGAQVFIGSNSAVNQTQGSAGIVTIRGGLSAQGVGNASAQISASAANITGDVSIFASQGSLQGTFTSQEMINGFLYDVTRMIGSSDTDGIFGTATYGKGNLDVSLSDNTADSHFDGKIDVRGNSASASINGGHNVTVGSDIYVGGFRNTNPQFDTPPPVYAEQVSYSPHATVTSTDTPPTFGPAITSHTESITGDVNVFAVGTDQALTGSFSNGNHAISVEGTGVAAIAIDAAGIQTGQVGVTGHAGSIRYQPAGGTATTTAFNDTGLLLHASNGNANTGQVFVNTEGNLHVGGNINAGANQVALQAPGSIDSLFPGALLAFSHPLDGGQFPQATQASRDLGALSVTTTDSIFFKFGADSSLDGLSLIAGKGLQVDGDFNATGTAHGLQVGANPVFKGGPVATSIHNVNLGATGIADIEALGAVGSNVDILNSTFGIASGAQNGSLAVNVTADQFITVNKSTFNVNAISLVSNGENISVLGGSNLIANTVVINAKGAGKDVSIDGSLISTNGGVTANNGDLKISSAGSFTINNSTLSDSSGGAGSISASGNGAASSISGSVLNFSGPLQIGVTGTGSSLSISGGSIGPQANTAGLIIGRALIGTTTPGDVSLSSSGDLSVNSTINAGKLTMSAGNVLHLVGTATAGNTLLSGTNGVIADSPGFTLSASSLGVKSTSGFINLARSNITVSNSVTSLGLDPAMITHLGIFKPVSTGPNAAFDAAGRVDLGNLTIGGDYLFIRSTQAVFNGNLVHSGSPLFYNYVPTNPASGVSTTGIGGFIGAYTATNGPNAVLTLAFGSSSFTGPVVTGDDVGTTPTNFVFITTNNVQGYDALKTQGQVAILKNGVLSIRGQTPPPPPPPPPVDPGTADTAADASFAVVNSPAPDDGQGSDINDAVNGATDATGEGDTENHSHDAVLEKSCS